MIADNWSSLECQPLLFPCPLKRSHHRSGRNRRGFASLDAGLCVYCYNAGVDGRPHRQLFTLSGKHLLGSPALPADFSAGRCFLPDNGHELAAWRPSFLPGYGCSLPRHALAPINTDGRGGSGWSNQQVESRFLVTCYLTSPVFHTLPSCGTIATCYHHRHVMILWSPATPSPAIPSFKYKTLLKYPQQVCPSSLATK